VNLAVDQIAAPVQTATSQDIDRSGALDVSDFLNRRVNGIHVNETQGNPFQPDELPRLHGSPLLGTPQGLSVFMDGVRLNQPFGEVVNWDLVPRVAISSIALMPGSNPLFGLNTLGGALAIQTKDGRNSPGTSIQVTYGGDVRRAVEFEHGGHRDASGMDWYVAGNLFAEDGWRDDSPSNVQQVFGKLAWRKARGELALSGAFADNSLSGNGLQEVGFLERDYASVYTKPDETDNRSTLLNLTARRTVGQRTVFSANAYYRDVRTDTLNGDINEAALEQPEHTTA
jgi:outer membrane cobalamin receptor